MKNVFKRGLAAATLAVFGAASSLQVHAAGDYLLATASTGGTYYPVGVALSTLVKVKLQPTDKINMSAINSAGSGENIKLLRDNESQFAILQGLYGAYAWIAVATIGGRITLGEMTMYLLVFKQGSAAFSAMLGLLPWLAGRLGLRQREQGVEDLEARVAEIYWSVAVGRALLVVIEQPGAVGGPYHVPEPVRLDHVAELGIDHQPADHRVGVEAEIADRPTVADE